MSQCQWCHRPIVFLSLRDGTRRAFDAETIDRADMLPDGEGFVPVRLGGRASRQVVAVPAGDLSERRLAGVTRVMVRHYCRAYTEAHPRGGDPVSLADAIIDILLPKPRAGSKSPVGAS